MKTSLRIIAACIAMAAGFSFAGCNNRCALVDPECGLGPVLFIKYRVPKFVHALTNTGIFQTYKISNGLLSPVSSTASAGTGASFGAIDPYDQFMAQALQTSANVVIYSINQDTGALTQTTSVSVPGISSAAFSIDGRFVYVVSGSGFLIGCYALNRTTGTLTFIENETIGGTAPNGIIADPSGRYVFMMDNSASAKTYQFTINSGGDITAASNTTYAGNVNPNNPVFVPGSKGLMAIVPNKNGASVSTFFFNPVTGLSSLLATTATVANPFVVDFVGEQNVFYVPNLTSALSRYRVALGTGTVTFEGAFNVGTQNTVVDIDPNGTYAAAADQSGSMVHWMKVDSNANLSLLSSYALSAATVVYIQAPLGY